MNCRGRNVAVRCLRFLLIVAIFVPQSPSSFRAESAVYAQTESEAPPATAPGLTAQAVGADSVELSWTAVEGASGYELWRWHAGDEWTQVGDAPAGTSYTDTGLAAGQTYHYAVAAVNAGGRGPWSEYAHVKLSGAAATPTQTPTPAGTPVAAPVLTALQTEGAVELRWTTVPGAARYELWGWWEEETGWQRISDSLTGTSYTHTEVVAGRTYFYAVRALDAASEPVSPYSDYASATPLPETQATATATPTPSATAPTPTATLTPTLTLTPTPSAATPAPATVPILTALAAEGAVELSWTAVEGAARYDLWTWWDNEIGWQSISDNLTGTTYTHTEVTAGTTYYYAIRVLDAASEAVSAYSDYASATPLPETQATATATPTPSATAPTPTATLTPTLTLTPTPSAAAGAALPPPPSSLGLDAYYRKYLDAGGIPVVAPADVDDAELYHARDMMAAMLSNRPDLLASMAANNFRVVIFRHDGCRGPFQIPEIRDDLPPGRCSLIAGWASWRFRRYAIAAVPNRKNVDHDYVKCNNVLVHEFAHLVHYSFQFSFDKKPHPKNLDSRIKSAYDAAMAAGLWKDTYASTNYSEYWAEAVTSWFLPYYLDFKSSANSLKLADYDPGIASLVEEVFGEVDRPDCGEVRVHGKVIGPNGEPMAGVYVGLDPGVINDQGDFRYIGSSGSFDVPTGADGVFVKTTGRNTLITNRDVVRLETGDSDLHIAFRFGVYVRKEGENLICLVGYLSRASGLVENMSWPFADAATFAMPTGPPYELSGITLQIAPNFDWTPIC